VHIYKPKIDSHSPVNSIDSGREVPALLRVAGRILVMMFGFAAITALSSCSRKPDTTAAKQRAVVILSQARFQEPAGWTWGTLVNADGAHLRFGWTNPIGAVRGVIIVAPSFQAPTEQYFETMRELSGEGFAVWIMDRRGQGGSERWPRAENRAFLMGGLREVRDLRQFNHLAVDRYPGTPAYLVGESLGGLVGLRLLHDSPELFTAAAFSSPGIDFQTNGVPKSLYRALTAITCALRLCERYAVTQHDWEFDANAGGPTDPAKDDPERAFAAQARLLTHPELREGGATNGFVKTLLEEADTEESADWAERISTPVLFGYTPTDRIARADIIESVCWRMPRCTLAKFETSGHALFSDADSTRRPWMLQLESFLESNSNNAQSLGTGRSEQVPRGM
jgi:lysophospholipase